LNRCGDSHEGQEKGQEKGTFWFIDQHCPPPSPRGDDPIRAISHPAGTDDTHLGGIGAGVVVADEGPCGPDRGNPESE